MRWDQLGRRLGLLVKYWIAQLRVLGQRYPGIMHVAIAWAFFVFFIGTTLAAIDGHFFQLLQVLGNTQAQTDPEAFKFLKGSIYLVYKLVLDTFTVAFLVGAGMAVYRRFVKKPSRLTLDARFTWSLVLIIVIVLGGLLTESLRLAAERPTWGWWAPAGFLLAQVWMATGASIETLTVWHMAIWSIHLTTVVCPVRYTAGQHAAAYFYQRVQRLSLPDSTGRSASSRRPHRLKTASPSMSAHCAI